MSRRSFSDFWYEYGRNPFRHLVEHWYQQYVLKHHQEFGFSSLEGPFKTGPDFKGVLKGSCVTVEVEREYLAYRQHGHKGMDVLIVGVVEPPHPAMIEFLPPVIMNVDPQVVMDWSKPFRDAYKAEMEKRRGLLPQQLERVRANLGYVKAFRIKRERVEFALKESMRCECGGQMIEDNDLGSFQEMSEGQLADHFAGFTRVLRCIDCGTIDLVETQVTQSG